MPRDHMHADLSYNDSNRAFLQSIMARGTLTFKEGQKLLASIFTVQEGRQNTADQVTLADFESYINAARAAISPFDYEIRVIQNQRTKEKVWGFVNSVSDPLTQMATSQSTDEILYIKRLLDGMFETYNTKRKEIMAINSIQALATTVRKGEKRRSVGGDAAASQAAADKGLTSEQAEKTLSNLIKEKWLERSRAGFYRLSPRALMELRSWLVEAYNDEGDDADEWQRIKFCVACKDIITVGQRCASLECNIRLHNICEESYWKSRPNKRCPKCNTPWDSKKYVGEMVVTSSEEYLNGQRRSSGSKGNKRSRAQAEEEPEAEVEEEAEEEPGEEDAEEEETEDSPAAAKRQRGQRGRPEQEESGEDDSDE